MNMSIRRLPGLVALAALLVPLAGCASPPSSGKQAVMCPKCEVVWVQRADPSDVYGLTYRSEQAMRCPDCEEAVATFFRTGRFGHACATCGDQLVHCTMHE
jgi:ribosomal protein S27E